MAEERKKVSRRKTPAGRKAIVQQVAAGLPAGYGAFLEEMKARIRAVQVRVALSANRELIELYWSMGRDIVRRQQDEGWGKAVVDRLAADLQQAFPGVGGFSSQNFRYMRAFYLAWAGAPKSEHQTGADASPSNLQQLVGEITATGLPQAVAQIPWGHNIQLIAKVKDPAMRLWYVRKTIEHAWTSTTEVDA